MRALALAVLAFLAGPARADEAAAARALDRARTEAGLAATLADPLLAQAARAIAADNAARGILDHTDAAGGTLRARALAEGYAFRLVVENLAVAGPDGGAIVTLWLDSAPHRANLLNPGVAHHGFARVRGPDGRDYWAAVLAAPLR